MGQNKGMLDRTDLMYVINVKMKLDPIPSGVLDTQKKYIYSVIRYVMSTVPSGNKLSVCM